LNCILFDDLHGRPATKSGASSGSLTLDVVYMSSVLVFAQGAKKEEKKRKALHRARDQMRRGHAAHTLTVADWL
jgi:hypothetical protein